MEALILADLQNDFCPHGALPVEEGDQVVPVANALMDCFELVVATQDWHPATHRSFAANHPWRRPGQVIDLNGLEQVLWPIHCVQESWGAEFVQTLHTEKVDAVFRKGTDPEIDSYSGFFDNGHRKSTGLGDFLQEKGVDKVYVLGLALDYCVKFTALDAKALGFDTYLIEDGCRAINLEAGDDRKAVEAMQEKGIHITSSQAVKEALCGRRGETPAS